IRLLWLILALRPTVTVGWLYYGALVASLARLTRVPVIWSLHAADFDLQSSFRRTTRAAIRACRRLSASVPASIHYCSEAARRHHERWGFARAKSVVIENGIDVGRIRQKADLPMPPDWAIPATGERLVCCLASFDPQKDHRTLLEACAGLKALGRRFRLVL